MQRVMIESPYAGDVERNLRYARRCMADSLSRGEAPMASHMLYTQEGVLKDEVPAERKQGIRAGYVWGEVADKIVFYTDYGMSEGMSDALHFYTNMDTEGTTVIEFRKIVKRIEKRVSYGMPFDPNRAEERRQINQRPSTMRP